jgi:hypothetical protein
MIIYEIKYYNGAGLDYFYYGKELVKNKWFYISHGVMVLEDYNNE